jgi:hypothetical protein
MRIAMVWLREPLFPVRRSDTGPVSEPSSYSTCELDRDGAGLGDAARIASLAISELRRPADEVLVVRCGGAGGGREIDRKTFPGVRACPFAMVAEVDGVDELASALVAHPGTNETLFAVSGDRDAIVAAFRACFAPDWETTPISEEAMLSQVTAIVTRGLCWMSARQLVWRTDGQ